MGSGAIHRRVRCCSLLFIGGPVLFGVVHRGSGVVREFIVGVPALPGDLS